METLKPAGSFVAVATTERGLSNGVPPVGRSVPDRRCGVVTAEHGLADTGRDRQIRLRQRIEESPVGRRSRAEIGAPPPKAAPVCPLCDRPIPPHARSSRHHLVPKLKGGAKLGTVLLHQICHSTIHARFSEAELARRLNAIEVLKNDPALTAFLSWIRTKPDDFHVPTRITQDRAGSRRAGRLRNG